MPFLSVCPFLVLLSSFWLLFGGKGVIFTDAGGYLGPSLLAPLLGMSKSCPSESGQGAKFGRTRLIWTCQAKVPTCFDLLEHLGTDIVVYAQRQGGSL